MALIGELLEANFEINRRMKLYECLVFSFLVVLVHTRVLNRTLNSVYMVGKGNVNYYSPNV
jgi:hypothetical protein